MRFLAIGILYFSAGGSGAVFAQTTTKNQASASPQSQVTADVLKKLDQFVQQNEQLETQNHELVVEIKSLRQLLAQQSSVSPTSSKGGSTASANSPAPANSTNKQAAQQSGQAWPAQGNNDDKTLLPQASQGNDAIFGEFNPGRGFTVGRGEYGELNLSGYMAVRI